MAYSSCCITGDKHSAPTALHTRTSIRYTQTHRHIPVMRMAQPMHHGARTTAPSLYSLPWLLAVRRRHAYKATTSGRWVMPLMCSRSSRLKNAQLASASGTAPCCTSCAAAAGACSCPASFSWPCSCGCCACCSSCCARAAPAAKGQLFLVQPL